MIYWSIIDQKFHELIHTQIACLTQCSFIFNYLIIDNSYLSCPKVCLFVCLYGVYRTTREFFTHMGTSSLLVKGCKLIWPYSEKRQSINQLIDQSIDHSILHCVIMNLYWGILERVCCKNVRACSIAPLLYRRNMFLFLSQVYFKFFVQWWYCISRQSV